MAVKSHHTASNIVQLKSNHTALNTVQIIINQIIVWCSPENFFDFKTVWNSKDLLTTRIESSWLNLKLGLSTYFFKYSLHFWNKNEDQILALNYTYMLSYHEII